MDKTIEKTKSICFYKKKRIEWYPFSLQSEAILPIKLSYFRRDMTFCMVLCINGIIMSQQYTEWRCHAHKRNEKKIALTYSYLYVFMQQRLTNKKYTAWRCHACQRNEEKIIFTRIDMFSCNRN